MKKLILLLTLLPALSFAQYEKEIDSLRNVITSKITNDDKAEAYDVLIQLYLDIDPKQSKKYIQELYALNKNNACIKCAMIADLNNGYYYDMVVDVEKALYYYDQCAEKSLIIRDYETYQSAKMQKAQTYMIKHNTAKSEAELEALLKFKKQHNLKSNTGFLYYLLGTLNVEKGFNKTAIENFIQGEKSLNEKKSEDLTMKVEIINMICVVYSNIKNHEKSRAYNDKALQIATKMNDVSVLMNIKRNRGFIEASAKNYSGAIPYLLEAYNFHKANNNLVLKGMEAYFLSKCYFETKNYQKSSYYANDAIATYKSGENKVDYARALNVRANVFLKNNDLANAKSDIDLSKSLMKDITHRNYLEIVDTEIEYYKKTNNIVEAFKSVNLKDSLNTLLENKTNKNSLNELEAQYQTEKKEQQIKLLSAQNELAQKQKYISIGLLGLLVLVGGSVFYVYKNKIKTAQKLNELNEMKSRFFANISHEFRTPLTLIKSPVQSLQSEIIDGNQKTKLNLIEVNSNRMLELVDQLLELSKIDSGNLKLILKEGNVSSFLTAIVESFEFQAHEKHIHFETSIQKTTDNNSFDKDVIEKIVTNLLTNAFKYSPEHEKITFIASVTNAKLQLIVSNSGSDVTKENLPKFFERFYQKSEENQGVGIGLALVKELVELYKGTIETHLEAGKLSFIIHLPLQISNEKAVVIPSKNEIPTVENRADNESELPILLLVDDNADIRTILRDIFREQYTILEAQDGEEALEMAQKEIPDCIISDVMMPKMDGFAFTAAIKNNELTSFIPVVLLTAKTSDQAHLDGLKSTADAFLTKPFNNEIVKATVNQLIAERKKLHLRYSQELVLKPVDIVINSIEEKFIEKLQHILEKELSNSEFSSEDFASAVGMSRMQLHRKLKSLFGVSATEFLRNERLKMAADLLKKGNGNISEIAYAVGFNDVSYFSKCFKEMFSATPSDYLNSKNTP